MADPLPAAFELLGVVVPIDRILPMKRVNADANKNAAFRRVKSSIQEVGLIEPLIVYRQKGSRPQMYSLLDGHLRLEALRQLNHESVPCLVSTDDESYTYNHKVNVMPPIQEHFMILKAIENGVSEAKIAAALSVDVASIRRKRDMLEGICPEAVEILKARNPSVETMREMRKVKPMRQIEMAELMVGAGKFTSPYAKCLVAATPEDQLVEPDKTKAVKGLKPEDMARFEREMEGIEQEFEMLNDSFGKNLVSLVLLTAFVRKLLDNSAVLRFLTAHHPDYLAEFQKIVANTSMDRSP